MRKGYSHWYAVSTVCIGAFMAALDASIINAALPYLERQFHVKMSEIEWIGLSYLLALAASILIFGKLADIFGRRWLYIIGFILFSLSSLFCGLSSTLSVLILFRVLQGIGAALLQANSVSIITSATPKSDLGKVIGFQASAQGIGLSLGPAIGGALLSFIGWKWLFFMNLPIGIMGTILGIKYLPKEKPEKTQRKFDYIGAFLLVPSVTDFIFILNMGTKMGWGTKFMIGCYFLFIFSFILFFINERKQKDPLVDLSLFKDSRFALGNLTSILSFVLMYATLFLTPYYFDQIRHLPIFQASLFVTAIPIGMTLFTPISGILSDRYGTFIPSVVGLSIAAIGLFLLAKINISGTYFLVLISLFMVGLGIGMFTPPNNSQIMREVPKKSLGVAGGILNMSRTIGMSLGVSFGGLSYQFFMFFYDSKKINELIYVFRSTYLIIALLAIFSVIITSISYHSKER